MDTPHSKLFNVVVLPTTPVDADNRHFILSASRRDGELRLVSPEWSETEIRAAFAHLDTPNLQVEELFRGRRMAFGERSGRKLFFTEAQLVGIGLAPVLRAAATKMSL